MTTYQTKRRIRKGAFTVPYPWCESDRLTRRYRDGWFDARDYEAHTDKIGSYYSRGRQAYLAGFEDGMRANAEYHAQRRALRPPPPPPPPAPGTWSPWPAPRASDVEPPPGFARRAQSEPLR